MDRHVQERLVGASILVALLVLIVPELLSGPKVLATSKAPALPASENTEPMRNVTVDLTTRKATANDVDSNDAGGSPYGTDNESATVPSAVAQVPTATQTALAAAPTITTLQAQQPAEPPAASDARPGLTQSARTAASHGPARAGWAVQLGMFVKRVNADKLVHQLKGRDMSAYVLVSGKGSEQRFKVRVGPLADRAAAERVRIRLAKSGHSGSLVPP